MALPVPAPASRPTTVPVLVFDGDCAFCTTSAGFVARWLRRSPADFAIEPWQHLDLPALGLTPAECDEAVRWVAANGIPDAGHVAIARALRASRWWVRPVGVLLVAPGISRLAARAYTWVAANRHRLPGGTPACSLPQPPPPAAPPPPVRTEIDQ